MMTGTHTPCCTPAQVLRAPAPVPWAGVTRAGRRRITVRSTTRVTDPADEHEHLQLQHRRRRVRVPGFWPAVLGGIIAIAAGVYCLDHHHLHGTNLIVISG